MTQPTEDINPTGTDSTEAHSEPERNTQLSDYGKLMRARFELAARHSEYVLPPAFDKRFHDELTELLEMDWNYFGAVDSLIVNSKIPFVVDVLRAADAADLLTEDEKKLVPERAGVSQ